MILCASGAIYIPVRARPSCSARVVAALRHSPQRDARAPQSSFLPPSASLLRDVCTRIHTYIPTHTSIQSIQQRVYLPAGRPSARSVRPGIWQVVSVRLDSWSDSWWITVIACLWSLTSSWSHNYPRTLGVPSHQRAPRRTHTHAHTHTVGRSQATHTYAGARVWVRSLAGITARRMAVRKEEEREGESSLCADMRDVNDYATCRLC